MLCQCAYATASPWTTTRQSSELCHKNQPVTVFRTGKDPAACLLFTRMSHGFTAFNMYNLCLSHDERRLVCFLSSPGQ